jgi:hypothetical protein
MHLVRACGIDSRTCSRPHHARRASDGFGRRAQQEHGLETIDNGTGAETVFGHAAHHTTYTSLSDHGKA